MRQRRCVVCPTTDPIPLLRSSNEQKFEKYLATVGTGSPAAYRLQLQKQVR